MVKLTFGLDEGPPKRKKAEVTWGKCGSSSKIKFISRNIFLSFLADLLLIFHSGSGESVESGESGESRYYSFFHFHFLPLNQLFHSNVFIFGAREDCQVPQWRQESPHMNSYSKNFFQMLKTRQTFTKRKVKVQILDNLKKIFKKNEPSQHYLNSA